MQLRRDTWRFVSRGTSFPFKVSPPSIFIPLRIALLFSIISIIFLICISRVLIDLCLNQKIELVINYLITFVFFFLNRGIDSQIEYNVPFVFLNFIIVGIYKIWIGEGLSIRIIVTSELRALCAIFFIVDSLFFSNNGIFIR